MYRAGKPGTGKQLHTNSCATGKRAEFVQAEGAEGAWRWCAPIVLFSLAMSSSPLSSKSAGSASSGMSPSRCASTSSCVDRVFEWLLQGLPPSKRADCRCEHAFVRADLELG